MNNNVVSEVSDGNYLRIKSVAREMILSKGWVPAENEWVKYQYKESDNRYPTLYLDDLGAIPQLDDIPGIEFYQQRARLRADTGDFVLLTHSLDDDYEKYNQTYLNLGLPTVLTVNNHGYHPLFISRNLLHNLELLSRIADAARVQGGLTIHPFIGSNDIWRLAKRFESLNAGSVRVLAPFPYVTAFINDKTEFINLVKSIIGDDAVVDTRIVYNEVEAVKCLKEMSDLYTTVAVKMRNYASAMGNIVFDGCSLRRLTPSEFDHMLKTKLWLLNWNSAEPLCIMRWYEDIWSSPSSHLWIPPRGCRKPIMEGIFEQLLEGDTKVFVGSKPALLSDELRVDITRKSMLLGIFLQELGYVGRCSFDMIVHGRNLSEAKMKFVECNGRWGGTSLPMALYKRLFGKERQFIYLARDYMDKRLVGRQFRDLLQIFNGTLFDVNTGNGCYLLYNVGCLKRFGKFDVMVFGNSDDELKYRAFQKIPSLINRYFS